MNPWIKRTLRFLRIACAICLITVSLWAIFLPPLFPHSDHAVVNTKAVTIRAEDTGRISDLPAADRLVLPAGDRIATVARDLGEMRRELQERHFTKLKLQEQLTSIDEAIEMRQRKLQAVEAEVATERLSAGETLEKNQKAATEKVRICSEALAEKRANENRIAPLFKDGIVTAAQWSEVREQTIEAERMVSAAGSELARIKSRLEALSRGVGGLEEDEMASAKARITAYEQEIGNLGFQRIELRAELGVVEKQIATAETYNETDQTYDLTAPIDGIIWRRHVVNGETLASGQAVAEVADVHSIFVEAYFRRGFMNSIAIGDSASIYLVGDSQLIEGRIVDIQVQERIGRDSNLISIIENDSTMLRVNIEVDSGSLKSGDIGRVAKVFVSSGRPGWVERGLIRLSLVLRRSQ